MYQPYRARAELSDHPIPGLSPDVSETKLMLETVKSLCFRREIKRRSFRTMLVHTPFIYHVNHIFQLMLETVESLCFRREIKIRMFGTVLVHTPFMFHVYHIFHNYILFRDEYIIFRITHILFLFTFKETFGWWAIFLGFFAR